GLVGVHDGVLLARVGVGDDHDDAGRQAHLRDVEEVHLHEQDDRVDRELPEARERAVHAALRGGRDRDDGDRVALGGRGRRDRLERADVARGREREEDHADGAEGPALEGARRAVGPVAELGHRREHAGARRLDDPGVAVGHTGDGLRRDAGDARDVGHRHAPRRAEGDPPAARQGGRLVVEPVGHGVLVLVTSAQRLRRTGVLAGPGPGQALVAQAPNVVPCSCLRKHAATPDVAVPRWRGPQRMTTTSLPVAGHKPPVGAPSSPPARRRRRSWAGWGFVGPFMAVFALVFLAPIAYSIYLSLFRTQMVGGTRFVGLENYGRAFSDPQFWEALGRVALFLVVQVPIMLGIALL